MSRPPTRSVKETLLNQVFPKVMPSLPHLIFIKMELFYHVTALDYCSSTSLRTNGITLPMVALRVLRDLRPPAHCLLAVCAQMGAYAVVLSLCLAAETHVTLDKN